MLDKRSPCGAVEVLGLQVHCASSVARCVGTAIQLARWSPACLLNTRTTHVRLSLPPRSSCSGLVAGHTGLSLLLWFWWSEEPRSATDYGSLSLQQWQAGALGFFGKCKTRVSRIILGIYAGSVRHELLD